MKSLRKLLWPRITDLDLDPDRVLHCMQKDMITINQVRAMVGNDPITGGDVPFSLSEKMMFSEYDMDRVLDAEVERGLPPNSLIMLQNGEIVPRST